MHRTIRREEAENYATPDELRIIDEHGGIHQLSNGDTMQRVAVGFASRYVHISTRELSPAGQQTTLRS